MAEPRATRTVRVENEEGIHLRAAILIAEKARSFESAVFLSKGNQQVEGTEVLQVVSLVAEYRETIELEAVGNDAQQAVDAVAQLFLNKFSGEDKTTSTPEGSTPENRP